MNKFLLVLCIVLSQGITTVDSLKISQDRKLAATAKVWGFLKYYHPQVAKGKFDWDAQLLQILPKVEQAENKEDLSKIYLDWIEDLGEIPICKKCAKNSDQDYFDKNFDLSWFDDGEVFTPELSDKLKFIEQNRFQGKNHYVYSQYKQVGNITLKNEPEYRNLDWANPNMRLLIAFKYWNIVEYFFPYKYQTDQPWDEVLLTAISQLQSASTEKEFHEAIQKLVVRIDDSHGWFRAPTDPKTYFWPAFKTEIFNDKLVVSGFYKDSLKLNCPLKKGDVILAFDEIPVQELMEENKSLVWGSNEAAKNRTLKYRFVRSTKKSSRKVKVLRGNQIKEAKVEYFDVDALRSKPNDLRSWEIIHDSIGYVNMGKLERKDVKDMMEKFKDTKAIIFDIRNYPKGTMYYIAHYLVPERRDFFKVTYPDLDYPGKFKWRDGMQCGSFKNKENYSGKVVLLVNENTQSHAEFTTMALQTADNVVTVGSQTAGADGNVSRLELGGGIKTSISGIGIFYPDGTETQRKGMKIDVEVYPTIEGIREGRDEVLEKAIEIAMD